MLFLSTIGHFGDLHRDTTCGWKNFDFVILFKIVLGDFKHISSKKFLFENFSHFCLFVILVILTENWWSKKNLNIFFLLKVVFKWFQAIFVNIFSKNLNIYAASSPLPFPVLQTFLAKWGGGEAKIIRHFLCVVLSFQEIYFEKDFDSDFFLEKSLFIAFFFNDFFKIS